MIDHPTVSTPHNRAPITVLECRADKLERKLTGLGRIFDALTTLPAPIKISSTVRRAQILTKRDEAVRAAWVKFTRATSPKATLPPSDSFQGLRFNSITTCTSLRRAVQETPTLKNDKAQKFSRCLECGEQFVDAEDKPTLSRFEFCGENPLFNGPCKAAWLEKHPQACVTRRKETPITIDAHLSRVGCRRAIRVVKTLVRPFGPLLVVTTPELYVKPSRYWCAECCDYLAKDHVCKKPAPSRALSVNLLNVWKPTPLEWGQLRRLKRSPATSRPVHKLKGEFRMDGEAYQIIMAERAKLITRDYAPRVIDYSEKPLDLLAEPGLGCFERSVCSTWKIAPPPPFSPDGCYIKWRERCFPSTPVESWYVEQCLLQLKRFGMPQEFLHDGPISCFSDLTHVDATRQRVLHTGGKRVSTTSSCTNDGGDGYWSDTADHNSRDYRADLIFNAQRPEKQIAHSMAICKNCGDNFLQVRKGHDYCTKNCCNRSSELTKGDN